MSDVMWEGSVTLGLLKSGLALLAGLFLETRCMEREVRLGGRGWSVLAKPRVLTSQSLSPAPATQPAVRKSSLQS